MASAPDLFGSFTPPSPEELDAALPGYEVTEMIAAGGMGAVYRGIQLSLRRPVALKILPREMSGDVAWRQQFERESRVMAQISHQNVVAIYDFGFADKLLFMAIEFIDGASLFQVLRKRPLKPEEIAHFMTQICDGLGAAHAMGIVHRDLKPANLYITKNYQVKIGDFGIARQRRPEQAQLSGFSLLGIRLGTPDYASPELMSGAPDLDHRSDIFSLGVLLYEMVAGTRPVGDRFIEPSKVRPGADPRFDPIVIRAMQEFPQDRYPDTAAMKADLWAAMRQPAEPARAVKPLRPLMPAPPMAARQTPAPTVRKPRPTFWKPGHTLLLGACLTLLLLIYYIRLHLQGSR